MSFWILRRFLNVAASNSKSIQLRRIPNTAASDSRPIHNGNGKVEGGSQCTAVISECRDGVLACPRYICGRSALLQVLAVAGVYLLDESISKADAEDLKRKLLENIPKDDDNESRKEFFGICFEDLTISEEVDKEHKLLLEEMEELERDKE
ncbi:hypothetical protein FNV43_RR15579 [Rhamnella rubrinervis]|uniref:Uncharacterized protein n=1 Tax=Rhamnella rubrinervis TaxID=2594499 RepID=A0A8K0E958_9ROSA|nr:hypothetical protein FNV43_RR15579 [Rhamnella rubrinervis]